MMIGVFLMILKTQKLTGEAFLMSLSKLSPPALVEFNGISRMFPS